MITEEQIREEAYYIWQQRPDLPADECWNLAKEYLIHDNAMKSVKSACFGEQIEKNDLKHVEVAEIATFKKIQIPLLRRILSKNILDYFK